MKKTSSVKKWDLPYSLLLDAQQWRAAAYTNTHALITEDASPQLVRFALEHTAKRERFDATLHAQTPHRRPLPAWANQEVQQRLEVLWIQRPTGDAPEAEWLAIPER